MGVDTSSAATMLAMQSMTRRDDVGHQAEFSSGIIFAPRLFSGLKSNALSFFCFPIWTTLRCCDFEKNSIIRLFACEDIFVPSSFFCF